MATCIDELSKLQPISVIHNDGVIDTIKSLCLRCKRATTSDELYEIVSDVEVLETAVNDSRTRSVINGSSKVMRERLNDYEDPIMSEFVEILTKSLFHSQKMVIVASLLHIASNLVQHGAIIDNVPPVFGADAIAQPIYYNIQHELVLKLPNKRALNRNMQPIGSLTFKRRWDLIKTECQFRQDAINPIRVIDINPSELNPGHRWGLTLLDYENDIRYLKNVYREGNAQVLRIRWEWGRKLWTLHAKRRSYGGWEDTSIVSKGRAMEMASRGLINNYVIT